ncbi:hypothetical protein H4R33_001560, partial [Dimargaris cristalligena]
MSHTPFINNSSAASSAGWELFHYVFITEYAKLGKKILSHCNDWEQRNIGVLCRALKWLVGWRKASPLICFRRVLWTELNNQPEFYHNLARQYPDALQNLTIKIADEPVFNLEWPYLYRRHVNFLKQVTHWKSLNFYVNSLASSWPRIIEQLAADLPWRSPSRTMSITTITHSPGVIWGGNSVPEMSWPDFFYSHSPKVLKFLGRITRLCFDCQTPIDLAWLFQFLAPFKRLKCLSLTMPNIDRQLAQAIIQKWPGLTTLQIGSINWDCAIFHSPNQINFRNLTALHLQFVFKAEDPVDFRALNPTDYPNLKRLGFTTAPVIFDPQMNFTNQNKMAAGFLQIIGQRWPKLESLILSHFPLNSQMVSRMAQNAPNIRYLRITNCPAMGLLCAHWLPQWTKLRSLVLSFTSLDELSDFINGELNSESLMFLCILCSRNPLQGNISVT